MNLDSITGFFTSKTGIFAAIAALLGLIGSVLKILQTGRAGGKARAGLSLSPVQAIQPPPWSEAGALEFTIQNPKGGKAVMSGLLLAVRDHGRCEEPKMEEAAAPVPQFTYKVRLSPGKEQYDVLAKEFGSEPPHSFAPGEVESVRVELTSDEPQWYELDLVVRWYDVKDAGKIRELRAPCPRIAFRPTVEQLLATDGDQPAAPANDDEV